MSVVLKKFVIYNGKEKPIIGRYNIILSSIIKIHPEYFVNTKIILNTLGRLWDVFTKDLDLNYETDWQITS